MKRKFIITCIIAVIASTLVGNSKPIIRIHTDCAKYMDNTTEKVLVWADAGFMHIRHLNILENCCKSFDPKVNVTHDTLLVYTGDNGAISCLCTCHYTLDYSISNLPYGKYVLMMADDKGIYHKNSLSALVHYEQDMDTLCIQKIELEVDTNRVFIVADSMPEFPDGSQALFAFIKEHAMQVDSLDQKHRVLVQFVVERDGSLTNIEVVQSSGVNELDRDAVAVVESMPKWKPGKQRGQPVRVKYTIPVTYRPQ